MDSQQQPRPHSSLIRQSSWSGLSESSSHESLSGSMVKSNSLNSMRASTDSKRLKHFVEKKMTQEAASSPFLNLHIKNINVLFQKNPL